MPTMNVPCAEKWYSFAVEHEGGVTVPFDFYELEDIAAKWGVSAYVDHVPNPYCLNRWCDENNVHLPDWGYQMVLGRWVDETLDGRGDQLFDPT